jgi:parallel beta-helix repeat protein
MHARVTLRWSLALTVVLALVSLLAAATRAPGGTTPKAKPAKATVPLLRAVNVVCGQTLSQNTKLDNDLSGCPGTGLVIGADGITLDLNKHTIDGSGSGNGIFNGGHRATIQNGTVTGFNAGVFVSGSSGSRVQNLRAGDNAGNGIFVIDSAAVVTGNTAFDNGGTGITLQGGGQVANNRANNSGTAGISVCFESSGGTVSGNTALSNATDGIAILSCGGDGPQATNNVANANGQGIRVVEATTKLTGNSARGNTNLGINALSGAVTDGGNNKASDNGSQHQCENVMCS